MPTASAVDSPAPAPSLSAIDALGRIQRKLVRPMPSDRLLGWLLPLGVTILGGVARFWRISRPGGHVMTSKNNLIFDETYYAHDSWTLLHHGVELNGPGTAQGFVVHPPLGKWMMAVGELLFDHGKTVTVVHKKVVAGSVAHGTIYPASPMSFRFMGAVVGTLAILIIARVARRMFRSTALGVLAAVLFSLDGLEFVQSRTAMLDIYLMFWVLAAFACLVADRDDGRRRLAERLPLPLHPSDWGPSLGFRPWRWAAGLCIGAACATKWDGAYYIPAFLILAVAWDIGARRTAGARTGLWWGALYAAGPAVLTFLLLPAAVYVASWTGWFLSDGVHAYDHDVYVHAGQSWFAHDRGVLHGWWKYQTEIWGYDKDLSMAKNPHPYLSRPWGWLLLARPVAYYYQSPGGCGTSSCSQEILGIGNPALWWVVIPAMVATAWAWIARKDWRGSAILLPFIFGYGVWLVLDSKNRVMFLFYMLPNLPFMVLAVTLVIGIAIGMRNAPVLRRALGMSAVAAYLATVVALFGFFYPVLAARTITYDQWHERMWFHHCQTKANTHEENAPCWI
jgi:dolichyl-phosphate-mannose-protein mannosyltransferase